MDRAEKDKLVNDVVGEVVNTIQPKLEDFCKETFSDLICKMIANEDVFTSLKPFIESSVEEVVISQVDDMCLEDKIIEEIGYVVDNVDADSVIKDVAQEKVEDIIGDILDNKIHQINIDNMINDKLDNYDIEQLIIDEIDCIIDKYI